LTRSLDQDMASRHRARFRSIQIIRVAEVEDDDVRRAYTKQLLEPELRFPLPHRVARAPSRRYKSLYVARRPTTSA
jgi:large subunit ribosomal protein L18Ae